MTIDNKVVAARIREARGTDNQSEAAEMVHSNQGFISKLESGLSSPSVSTLVAYSKAYGVSIDWLLGLSDMKKIGELNTENLTYEQVMQCISVLFEKGLVEKPNLGSEAYPEYDPGTIRFKNILFQYLMTRRDGVATVGQDMLESWERESLSKFNLPLLDEVYWEGDQVERQIKKNGSPKDDTDWKKLYEQAQIEEMLS